MVVVGGSERDKHMKDKTCERFTRPGFPFPSTSVVPCANSLLSDPLRSSSIQYQSLRKCSGAPQGTTHNAVNIITGVESIETKMDTMQAWFMARSMCNGLAMEGLWPADFEKSEEKNGRGRH